MSIYMHGLISLAVLFDLTEMKSLYMQFAFVKCKFWGAVHPKLMWFIFMTVVLVHICFLFYFMTIM